VNSLACNDFSLTPVVKWCLEDILCMKDYDVNVRYCIFTDMRAGEFTQPNQVCVSQTLEHHHSFRTLFHELRHYYQFKTGMFSFDAHSYYSPVKPEWDEQRRSLERYFDYLNFPWEMDADKFAFETLRQFWKTSLGISYTLKSPPVLKDMKDFVVNPVQADPSYPTFLY
jgi:hypothetical protein